MKKKKTILTIALSFCALGFSQAQDVEKTFIRENMEFAARQYELMLKTPSDAA